MDRKNYYRTAAILTAILAAVILVVEYLYPGYGVALAVLSTPAFVFTVIKSVRGLQRDRPLGPGEKVGTFLVSFGCMMMCVPIIISALGIALFITCLAGGLNH